MIEDAKTVHADASVGLNQSETEPQVWSQPTLTTWEVPEETQADAGGSGHPI